MARPPRALRPVPLGAGGLACRRTVRDRAGAGRERGRRARRRRARVRSGPCAGRFRLFRYEIRRWRDGVIPDVAEAVESPQRLSDDAECARRLLELVPQVPTPVWGRDELRAGEMWNSNSLISWLIARSGLDVESIRPPAGGRAPGWQRRHRRSRAAQQADADQLESGRLCSMSGNAAASALTTNCFGRPKPWKPSLTEGAVKC